MDCYEDAGVCLDQEAASPRTVASLHAKQHMLQDPRCDDWSTLDGRLQEVDFNNAQIVEDASNASSLRTFDSGNCYWDPESPWPDPNNRPLGEAVPYDILAMSPCPSETGTEFSSSCETEGSMSLGHYAAGTSNSLGNGSLFCRACKQFFSGSGELAEHAGTTHHRTYVCQETGCGKSYYRRDTYVRHVSTHRRTNLHVCMICPAESRSTFKRSDHLKQHQRNCHPASCDALERKSYEKHCGNPPSFLACQGPGAASSILQVCSPRAGNRLHDSVPHSRRSLDSGCVKSRANPSASHKNTMRGIAEALEKRFGGRQDETLDIIATQLNIHDTLPSALSPVSSAAESRTPAFDVSIQSPSLESSVLLPTTQNPIQLVQRRCNCPCNRQ